MDVTNCLQWLGGLEAKYLTALDLVNAYCQLELAEESHSTSPQGDPASSQENPRSLLWGASHNKGGISGLSKKHCSETGGRWPA